VNSSALRTLVIYAVLLPLAVFIGWTAVDLANFDRMAFATFVVILFVLLLPIILKWHYPTMIFSWHTGITIFFLPGTPGLWMLMAGLNFGIAFLNRIIQKRQMFFSAAPVTLSLLFLLTVVLMTANLRGGLGVQALGGSAVGGKGYYFIIAAILGYFAFASQPIPIEKAKLYAGLFFLPGLIGTASHLVYFAGPAFYFLFLLVPVGHAALQASTEVTGISRMAGFWAAATSLTFYFASVYGIRGILQKWWRLALIVVVIGLGTLSGFRSMLLMLAVVLVILFAVEGLFRSSIFPILLLCGALGFAALFAFSTQLPNSMQRTLSFLPIKVNPAVKVDAESSIEWRLYMWRVLVPQLPNYFWLGKGYAINPTDLYLAEQASLRKRTDSRETVMLVGDYHNGPLSVYIPFGFFGSLAFVCFLATSIRALYLNVKYGAAELRTINRFLFAYFLGRTIFFFAIFGAISSDLFQFTGVIGLGIALNRGVAKAPAAVSTRPVPLKSPFGQQALPAA
jgi:hypothetical protein